MNVMLCLKCCVLWNDRQIVLTRLSSCKKLIYSLILLGCVHLRIGVAFHKPTSAHFTLSTHEEYETTAACSLVGFFFLSRVVRLPSCIKKTLPAIVNLTKNIRLCLWQNFWVFTLKPNNQLSTYLKLNTMEMVHNRVTVFKCAARGKCTHEHPHSSQHLSLALVWAAQPCCTFSYTHRFCVGRSAAGIQR